MSRKRKQNRRPEPGGRQDRVVAGRAFGILATPVLIALVCLLVYGSSVQFGLTTLDDESIVSAFAKRQFRVMDALNRDAFMSEKSDSFYRPLQSLVFMAASSIGGRQPALWHCANVVLHCIAVYCLLLLLLQLGYPRAISVLAAMIYAVNPVFAQAVAWIPGCGDLLLGIFGILSFYVLLKYCAGGNQGYLVLHSLVLLLAALSKETALVLPVIFSAYVLFVERKKALRFRYVPLAAAWILVLGIYFILRRAAVQSLPDNNIFGIGILIENLRVLPETIAGFVLPLKLSVLPSFTLMKTLTGLAAIAAIAAAVLVQGKQGRPMVIIGCLWFILLSMPGMAYRSQFGSNGYNYLNHRAYLPMVGILLILIEAFPRAWLAQRRRELYVAGGAVVVLLCILAHRQSACFADALTFYDQAIQTNPKSALAYNHRGKFKADSGDGWGALADYDNAIRLYPKFSLAYNNRAEAKGLLGDTPGAIDDLSTAMAIDPDNVLFYSNRGRWHSVAGNTAAALADYDRGIALNSHFASIYSNRGVLRANAGDWDGAEADFAAALAQDPQFTDAMFNRGLIRMRRGDKSTACSEWLRASQLQDAAAGQAFRQSCR
jgi:protein O-mannosyl-transferase